MQGQTGFSVLVVDDAKTEQVRVSGLLSRHGPYQISTAANGVEALECLGRMPVDLVLTDLQMPEMNGLDLVRRVRDEYPQIPVILMTAAGSEEIAVSAMQEGAASYLSKTARIDELLNVVRRVLDARAEGLVHQLVLDKLQQDVYELVLGNSRLLMSATARFLRNAMQAMALCPQKELVRVGIALEEALLNACLHGNLGLDSRLREDSGEVFETLADTRSRIDPWQGRRVRVTAQISRRRATVTILDEGSGFNPARLPDPTDPENLLKPHGRGVMMMRLFMDDVFWNETGNQVTMIKNASAHE
ncbi:MAG: response regulator [Planctomycetaceae bacterium]|nr:response regulator [Planctomycetaceae bacterium]